MYLGSRLTTARLLTFLSSVACSMVNFAFTFTHDKYGYHPLVSNWCCASKTLLWSECNFICWLHERMKSVDVSLHSVGKITYSMPTQWSRVLLEKPTCLQLVKKFPAFHGTRRFITTLTSARHLSLSWGSLIQSIPPHPTSWRSILWGKLHYILLAVF